MTRTAGIRAAGSLALLLMSFTGAVAQDATVMNALQDVQSTLQRLEGQVSIVYGADAQHLADFRAAVTVDPAAPVADQLRQLVEASRTALLGLGDVLWGKERHTDAMGVEQWESRYPLPDAPGDIAKVATFVSTLIDRLVDIDTVLRHKSAHVPRIPE